jgi:O-acetyl-ADP-ribose deacetylase (regulator of RNase III)
MAMCFDKINADFKGEHLGIPRIGCGLAGGDWEKVKELINQYLSDMKQVTVVNLKS